MYKSIQKHKLWLSSPTPHSLSGQQKATGSSKEGFRARFWLQLLWRLLILATLFQFNEQENPGRAAFSKLAAENNLLHL